MGDNIYLTEREYEVISLIAEGLNNTQIAKKMMITISTVKAHIGHIYQKLNLERASDNGEVGAMRVKAALAYLNRKVSFIG